MKLIVTGGGTGGHVYPALEVAGATRARGWNVLYLGSERGLEGRAAERAGLAFEAFPSEPIYRLTSMRGVRSVFRMLRSAQMAVRTLEQADADAVLSTGGYASAPIVHAARKVGLPLVIHEQNSVPGRTNQIASKDAEVVCTVFRQTERHFPNVRVVRTGMPIRREMRTNAQGRLPISGLPASGPPTVLVMGGSQGSGQLNDAALATAVRMTGVEVQWLHLTGASHYESTMRSLRKLAVRTNYVIKAYLEAEEMAEAFFGATLAFCRSGAGTLSELAAFRKAALLVPYPYAYAQHQLKNAREFESLGAADVVTQTDLQPSSLERQVQDWLCDGSRRKNAEAALADWDLPDATERIIELLAEVRR